MESPSGWEKPAPEPPRLFRPPGLEMGRGLAIFSLVFTLFAAAQMVVLIQRVLALTPELGSGGFSLDLLDTEPFRDRWNELAANGDVLAQVSLWSGLIGLLALFLATWLWKRQRTKAFLALGLPHWRPFLAWLGFFVLVFAALEGIALLLPDLDSGFMEKVLGSYTDPVFFLLGVAVLPALFEEFLLRGLLYGSLRHLLDKHVSIALVAGLFTLIHPQYEWYLQLLYVLPMGVFLGYARANTGSIWTSVVLHLLNNVLSIVLPQFV